MSNEMMTDVEAHALIEAHGTGPALLEQFVAWLVVHRILNPDDTREDLELVPAFADEVAPA